ncbi:UDP-N-acetylglucosamine 2-epimerase [Plesiomonas shigelloides]|uniref:UDP-N-acetylglucosamine 2-epimerase n=1 Tax=Plesiomonas shigelloides TaxID=703 RepID=UPI0015B02F86|nr:UDP-N-acetylglucosamine 2-epimerase [Plesiomonas shigelloides]
MKKVVFITGTRADFGKLKSLIIRLQQHEKFDVHIFVTGMHMMKKYGDTKTEVRRLNINNTFYFINQNEFDSMDVVLSKTIGGFSDYVKNINPDLVVVHGDRVETLAGTIVSSLNNIRVAHIEGGEVSGTIDEVIRHAVSKMANLHFVCNQEAKRRLMQLGEREDSIFVIGSPDIDIMTSSALPSIYEVKEHYGINFDKYAIFMYHPVTTEIELVRENIRECVASLIESGDNFIVIYPNNDHGTNYIIDAIDELRGEPRFKVYPSIAFERFLVLIKNAQYIIGNSSAGVREAPFYGVPTVNIGSRQNNRSTSNTICNVRECRSEILKAIESVKRKVYSPVAEFGCGDSCELFAAALDTEEFWLDKRQKQFIDILK